jgi:hypothetical protein
MNRRLFVLAGIGCGASLARGKVDRSEIVYRFAIGDYEIRMSVEYFDAYTSSGFSFRDDTVNRIFCYSANGERDRGCLPNFSGSIAIARYHIQPFDGQANSIALREDVRTIDQDSRLGARPPFKKAINFERGIASDIQAFGSYVNTGSSAHVSVPPVNDLWCFVRQDLYLDRAESPFLVVHWKQTLRQIRLLDLIPGEQTRLLSRPEGR